MDARDKRGHDGGEFVAIFHHHRPRYTSTTRSLAET
jgi:hypothetical protein